MGQIMQGVRISIIISFLARSASGQVCSNDTFSIGYNGITAFEVSNVDHSCRCSGSLSSDSGISRVDTLSVNNLNVAQSANIPCPSSCQTETSSTLTQVAVLNATVVSLQASLAALQALPGCSGSGSGGGGGESGGSGASFCTVTRPVDGYVVGYPTRVNHAATVTYACNTGFNLTGFAAQTCVGGLFDHDLPVCVPLPCAGVAPANGAASPSLVPSGGTVTYSCNSGYTLNGVASQRCYAASFNASLPTCVGNPCTTSAPGNGTVTATNVPHGSSVTYSCNSGYSIIGVATQTCTAGSMSGTLPTCGPGYRNCYVAKQTSPSLPSGIYPIDPDGSAGPAPRINVFCDMTTDGGGWASIFTLSGSLSLGGTTCMFSYGNDDMDSTIMWSDLTCKVSNANADNTDGAKYFTVTRGGSADQSSTVLQPRPAGVNGYARPCPLPGSQRVVWFDWQTSMIYWDSGSASFASVGIGSYTNCYSSYGSNFFIISDNIDTVLTGCPSYGNTLLRFNFVDNTVTGTYVSSTFYPQSSNWFVTEQDEFGVVLFTVNGKIFYYNGGSYYALGGTLGNPNVFTNQWAVSRPSGYDTQFGIDMTGWVDTSGRLWLADWGHDDGGYFACSNDYQLGTAPTNIYLTY